MRGTRTGAGDNGAGAEAGRAGVSGGDIGTGRTGTGAGTKGMASGESAGHEWGTGTWGGLGVSGGRHATCRVQTVCGDTHKGLGKRVFIFFPPAPPPPVPARPRHLPDPEKSKSASSTLANGGGDASVAPPLLQPSSPPCGLRSWLSAVATTVQTAAGGLMWLPLREQFSKQRPPVVPALASSQSAEGREHTVSE